MDPENERVLSALIAGGRSPSLFGAPLDSSAASLAAALLAYGRSAYQRPASFDPGASSEPDFTGHADTAPFLSWPDHSAPNSNSSSGGNDADSLGIGADSDARGDFAGTGVDFPFASIERPVAPTSVSPDRVAQLSVGSDLQPRDPSSNPACSFCHLAPPNWDPFAPQPLPPAPKSDQDRQKVLDQCHRQCADRFVGSGRGSDTSGLYRRCVRQCMQQSGYDGY